MLKKILFVLLSCLFCIGFICLLFIGDQISVVYIHETNYNTYKNSSFESFSPLPVSESPSVLLENERYQLAYSMGKGCFDSPDLAIRNKDGSGTVYLFLKEGFTVFDAEIEKSLYSGSSEIGYYDPYLKLFDPYIRYYTEGEKIVFKILAVERFFIGNSSFPNALLPEDYERLCKEIVEKFPEDSETYIGILNNTYISTVPSENLTNDFWGMGAVFKKDLMQEIVYCPRIMSTSSGYYLANEVFKALGITVEEKRLLESKVVNGGYEAYMAVITLTLDIAGDYPKLDIGFEMISPKKHNVSEIRLGSLTCQEWNDSFISSLIAEW